MAELFRKDSLQKLSSTELLNRMIPLIRPSFWLVLAGAAGTAAVPRCRRVVARASCEIFGSNVSP